MKHRPSDLHQSQSSVEGTSSEDSLSNIVEVNIELQAKSDFLRARPDFNTASVDFFSASQLSQFPHSDSESELAPSQFWVPSSQPSQDIIIGDSQPPVTTSSLPDQVVPATKSTQGISQTTIPDSQDLSNDFSQNIVEVPGTAEQPNKAASSSAEATQERSSGSTIPPHQPNINQVSFAQDLLIIDPEQGPLSQRNS